MAEHLGNVLFLCTGNSARSILAEALLTHLSKGAFTGYSAGSFPKGAVHPMSLQTLERQGLPTAGLRSKSWDEFAGAGAPQMDFIFTVCDQAAGEVCPVWPGHPVTAHWGLPDPAAVTTSPADQPAAFQAAYRIIEARVRYFLSFARKPLDRNELKRVAAEAGTVAP
jgi:arsenate reductase